MRIRGPQSSVHKVSEQVPVQNYCRLFLDNNKTSCERHYQRYNNAFISLYNIPITCEEFCVCSVVHNSCFFINHTREKLILTICENKNISFLIFPLENLRSLHIGIDLPRKVWTLPQKYNNKA